MPPAPGSNPVCESIGTSLGDRVGLPSPGVTPAGLVRPGLESAGLSPAAGVVGTAPGVVTPGVPGIVGGSPGFARSAASAAHPTSVIAKASGRPWPRTSALAVRATSTAARALMVPGSMIPLSISF